MNEIKIPHQKEAYIIIKLDLLYFNLYNITLKPVKCDYIVDKYDGYINCAFLILSGDVI